MLAVMEQRRYFAKSLSSIYVFSPFFTPFARNPDQDGRRLQYLIDRTNEKLLERSFHFKNKNQIYILYHSRSY